ncbi:50S ribosomal protein L28 [Thiospirochaeta perfilievii]|uniref:Large ribosomal subunit protein bL28 n=1 Tax=Thiospirochaeta perfilievii TaxID=252967 RepID=A0A5C1Q8D5_9SPIO|nr:50S ribosomal protein L28 [Thiospirochaeta perfilievii]QEN03687.1 50S ribosomal protein L28 [Thiospirochaeta perfilievii]
MARKCELCGKGTIAGNSVPRKGLPKKKGGAGQHIGVKSKRTFKPNIVKVQATVAGSTKSVKVCTRCLKAGKVEAL